MIEFDHAIYLILKKIKSEMPEGIKVNEEVVLDIFKDVCFSKEISEIKTNIEKYFQYLSNEKLIHWEVPWDPAVITTTGLYYLEKFRFKYDH